ncbi:MAG: sigma-70 family RNA polymerase sigma factor [Anaerolineae bacterium]|nr:sigma-70 family RNA polymerase sigma factor [Anaerolineae bacterium]
MTDTNTLIKRWQAGDQRAAEALYNCYRDQTFRLAYGLLGNPADAEEAAQDALTYALTHIRRYDPQRAGFSTWLHTITVSRCRDKQRQRRRFLDQFSLTAWLQKGGNAPDSAPGQEQQVVAAEIRGEVLEAVQTLSPSLREAILLRYWVGHTYREMAEILDCPIPTAQSRVRMAYQRLRAALAPGSLADLSSSLEEERV